MTPHELDVMLERDSFLCWLISSHCVMTTVSAPRNVFGLSNGVLVHAQICGGLIPLGIAILNQWTGHYEVWQ